jgi:hypothetical protein
MQVLSEDNERKMKAIIDSFRSGVYAPNQDVYIGDAPYKFQVKVADHFEGDNHDLSYYLISGHTDSHAGSYADNEERYAINLDTNRIDNLPLCDEAIDNLYRTVRIKAEGLIMVIQQIYRES